MNESVTKLTSKNIFVTKNCFTGISVLTRINKVRFSHAPGFFQIELFLNSDSLYGKMSSHYEEWSYRKKKHKKFKAYMKSV